MTTQIIIEWFLRVLGFISVVLMFWYFSCTICKKTYKRCILVIFLILLCVFGYYLNHRKPSVVIMQEDVLYIKPPAKDS